MRRINFYKKIISKYLENKTNNKILVLGAGRIDLEVFKDFSNVSFTNVMNENIENQKYKIIDKIYMQKLPFENESYDYVITHASIHHCSQPHAAILEMYRVAKHGVIFIESQDCFLTRLSCKIGLSEEFEISAVKNRNFGGVDNTSIANFVYRWTESEIYKLINSYDPQGKFKIIHNYDYDFKFLNNRFVNYFFAIFFFIFKNQKNLMSTIIFKKN
jgi:ubiquinone/menaquinone biosynthesis C-methylase UbiE